MFPRNIRTLYTTARALAEQPKSKAAALGFSGVKRTRELPALNIPTTGGADILGVGPRSSEQRSGPNRPFRGSGEARRPRYDNGPRQDGERRPRQAAGERRPPRQEGERRPRQDGDRPRRPRQEGGRPPRRQEAAASAAEAPAPAAGSEGAGDFFEGIELADMSAPSAPKRFPRGERADGAPSGARGDRGQRSYGGPGGERRRMFAGGARGPRPPHANGERRSTGPRGARRSGSRKDDKSDGGRLGQQHEPVDFTGLTVEGVRERLLQHSSVPLAKSPAPGSPFDMYGPRSLIGAVPKGPDVETIAELAKLTGQKSWKVEQQAILARLGDYSLFQARVPDTVSGAKGAAQRAKFELRRNKTYDPLSQAYPAAKVVMDAVGAQH